MPGQWNQVNQAQGAQRNTFVDIAAAMMAQAELLRQSEEKIKRGNRELVRTNNLMQSLSRHTREFAGNLSSATSTLLKWTGVTGVVGTLTGLLSGEGVARLAGYGAATYRSSMGFAGPTSAGQVGAAGAYGGILNPHAALGQLTEMLTTGEGKRGLASLGIGPEMWGRGAGAILPTFLSRLQGLAKRTPEPVLGDVLGGMGLGGFGEQARILKRMSPQQLAQLDEIRVKNERELNTLTEQMLFKWVKLSATLDLAGTKIHYAFVEGLAELTPQIQHLVDAFSTAVAAFIKSDEVKAGIERFANYLGTPEFKSDVTGFIGGVGKLAKGLVAVLKIIEDIVYRFSPHDVPEVNPDYAKRHGFMPQDFSWWNPGSWLKGHHTPGTGPGEKSQPQQHFTAPIPPATTNVHPLSNFADPVSYGQMRAAALAAGFVGQAADVVAAIGMAESGGGLNKRGAAGEYGPMQIHPVHQGAASAMGDLKRSMEMSYRISKGGTDFSPWSTYNDRKYQKFLGGSSATASNWSTANQLPGWGRMSGVEGMIVHHTAGGRNISDVMNVFRQRGVGSNFVIDKEGNVFQTIPEGMAGRHIMSGWGPKGEGKSNRNFEGVEIIAADDAHVSQIQKEAAVRLINSRSAKFGYNAQTSVFGHGEVNPGHRQDSEGMGVVNIVRSSGIRVNVTHDTGGSAVTSAAQVQ